MCRRGQTCSDEPHVEIFQGAQGPLGKPIGEFGLIKEKLAEMAIRIFAAESIIYRTAGYINEAMRRRKVPAIRLRAARQVLAEYAEWRCSIAKVHGAEMLDFVVDEAVKHFGGYGFREDYPVCVFGDAHRPIGFLRAPMRSNRTVMILTLLKRATGGQLPTIPAAQEPADETQAGPSKEGTPAGVLAEEWGVVANVKRIFLQALAGGAIRIREKLANEQELIGSCREHRDGDLRHGVRLLRRRRPRLARAKARNSRDDGIAAHCVQDPPTPSDA